MTRILAFAGRKQSGKNTAYNFLLGITLLNLAVVRDKIQIKNNGKLWISDLFGDESVAGIAAFVDARNEKIDYFNNNYVYPFIKNYSFADVLKQDVCIKILGLSWEQCYGTDEEKMAFTHLRWEGMPGVTTEVTPQDPITEEVAGRLGKYYEKVLSGVIYHEPGPMTGRDVMQFVGTEIFRRMYGNVWAKSTINRIINDKSKFGIITDCRFPNEVEAVQQAGGKVIRFTRNPFPEDKHDSETSLDRENFDWERFDAVIDNEKMSISDQNGALIETLIGWGWDDLIKTQDPVRELVKQD